MAIAEDEAVVDTSVAIPLVVADHGHHRPVVEAVGNKDTGPCRPRGLRDVSILTRLPPPARRSPSVVGRLIAQNFPVTRFLSEQAAAELLGMLGTLGVAGGAVYDALVGTAAVEHGLTLLTRDRRAADTYRRIDVKFVLLN